MCLGLFICTPQELYSCGAQFIKTAQDLCWGSCFLMLPHAQIVIHDYDTYLPILVHLVLALVDACDTCNLAGDIEHKCLKHTSAYLCCTRAPHTSKHTEALGAIQRTE